MRQALSDLIILAHDLNREGFNISFDYVGHCDCFMLSLCSGPRVMSQFEFEDEQGRIGPRTLAPLTKEALVQAFAWLSGKAAIALVDPGKKPDPTNGIV